MESGIHDSKSPQSRKILVLFFVQKASSTMIQKRGQKTGGLNGDEVRLVPSPPCGIIYPSSPFRPPIFCTQNCHRFIMVILSHKKHGEIYGTPPILSREFPIHDLLVPGYVEVNDRQDWIELSLYEIRVRCHISTSAVWPLPGIIMSTMFLR